MSVYLYGLPSCLPFTFFLWSSICFARREIFKQNFHSRQVNTLGIFITLSQKIICRLQSRGFGDCIGFRYMNESIFKNNIHHLKQAKEIQKQQKNPHSISPILTPKPMWIEIIRRVIYKLLWDFQNTPPRFPRILEVSINSTHSISLFPYQYLIYGCCGLVMWQLEGSLSGE